MPKSKEELLREQLEASKRDQNAAEDEAAKLKEQEENATTDEEKFVARKAYEEVTSSMHKFKRQNKELEAEVQRLKAEREADEQERLKEKEDYRSLSERLQAQNEELKKKMTDQSSKFLNSQKKAEVVSRLGGFKKPEYADFIKTENVVVDDSGNFDEVSLQAEVDRIKQTYPETLKSHKTASLPADAPGANDGGKKNFKDMTPREREEWKREQVRKMRG